jgi:hypothetical protein
MEGSSPAGLPLLVLGSPRTRSRSTCLPAFESNVMATTKITVKTATNPPIQMRPLRAAVKPRETVSDSPTMIAIYKLRLRWILDPGWPVRNEAVVENDWGRGENFGSHHKFATGASTESPSISHYHEAVGNRFPAELR